MPYLKAILLLLLTQTTTTYTYDPTGNLSTITHANNTKEHYNYDDLNRLTSLIHKKSSDDTTLASFSYTLSPIGERTKIEELTRTTSYSYDDLSRVLTEEITDSKNGDYQVEVSGVVIHFFTGSHPSSVVAPYLRYNHSKTSPSQVKTRYNLPYPFR
jgi:YD repeat-containing protein